MTTSNFAERDRKYRRSAILGLLFAIILHAVLAILVAPFAVPEPIEVTEPEKDEFEIEVMTEDALVESDPDQSQERKRIADVKPRKEKPEPREKKEKRVEPKPVEMDKRKSVVQKTNEDRPDEAKFVSNQDNKVEKETRARETKLDSSARAKREEQLPTREMKKRQMPSRQNEEQEQVEPRPEGQAEKKPLPEIDPQKLFETSMADYDRVLGNASRDQEARERMEAQDGRRKLLSDFGQRDEAFRASLENFIPEVQPGNHTGVNAHRNVYAGYIARIHRKIHIRWANGYLMSLDTSRSYGDPLNNPRLRTILEFVIDASTGNVENVNIVSTSGELQFDAEAVAISQSVGPHPSPPPEIVSPNGRIYIHWAFNRDQRQCGTFGASVFIVDTDEG